MKQPTLFDEIYIDEFAGFDGVNLPDECKQKHTNMEELHRYMVS